MLSPPQAHSTGRAKFSPTPSRDGFRTTIARTLLTSGMTLAAVTSLHRAEPLQWSSGKLLAADG